MRGSCGYYRPCGGPKEQNCVSGPLRDDPIQSRNMRGGLRPTRTTGIPDFSPPRGVFFTVFFSAKYFTANNLISICASIAYIGTIVFVLSRLLEKARLRAKPLSPLFTSRQAF